MSAPRKRRRLLGGEHLKKIADAKSFRHPCEGRLVMGNVVQLNSGGPRMMIVADHHREWITAAWLDDAGKPDEGDFLRSAVHRVGLL